MMSSSLILTVDSYSKSKYTSRKIGKIFDLDFFIAISRRVTISRQNETGKEWRRFRKEE